MKTKNNAQYFVVVYVLFSYLLLDAISGQRLEAIVLLYFLLTRDEEEEEDVEEEVEVVEEVEEDSKRS